MQASTRKCRNRSFHAARWDSAVLSGWCAASPCFAKSSLPKCEVGRTSTVLNSETHAPKPTPAVFSKQTLLSQPTTSQVTTVVPKQRVQIKLQTVLACCTIWCCVQSGSRLGHRGVEVETAAETKSFGFRVSGFGFRVWGKGRRVASCVVAGRESTTRTTYANSEITINWNEIAISQHSIHFRQYEVL